MKIRILFCALFPLLSIAHASPPNIILINVDDMGYGDLACYGSEVNDTPHIDRLAKEGMRFTDFYANITSISCATTCMPRVREHGNSGTPFR